MPGPSPRITVGRVGRAHGVKGEVVIDVRTDAPELRFAPGATLFFHRRDIDKTDATLTVDRSRWHSDKLLVQFAGVGDRDAAEALTGNWLAIDQEQAGEAGEDAYWDHELIGLKAVAPDGAGIGEVTDVNHASSQPLLTIHHDERDSLVPFVAAFVTDVDLAEGTITLDLPEGLLEL